MNIYIVIGHSGHQRFAHSLAEEYARGAIEVGATVRIIALDQISFDPILHEGYSKIQELEPDLKQAQDNILWADHLVFIYPLWWGSFPAILKGFIDRVILPGVCFKFIKGKKIPQKLLAGKRGRVIITADADFWLGRFLPAVLHFLSSRLSIWGFTGVSPVRMTVLGPVFKLNDELKKKWFKRIYRLGLNLK